MALTKSIETIGSKLDTIPVATGQVIYSRDTKRLYIDSALGSRIEIKDIEECTEAERVSLIAPLNKMYLIKDTKALWYYSGVWTKLSGSGGDTVAVIDNLTTQSATAALSANMGRVLNGDKISKKDLLNFIYHVGVIYLSLNTLSPATLFGGAWEQLKNDAYIKIVNNSAGSWGGTSSHKHLQSVGNNANAVYFNKSPYGSELMIGNGFYMTNSQVVSSQTLAQDYTNSADNSPYYYGVYAWKRVS